MSDTSPPSVEALLEHSEWVRALARRLVGDAHAAEDLAQEALAVAVARPPRHARHLRGWFALVLRNLQRQRGRRVREVPLEDAEGARALSGTDEVVERAEAQQLVVEEVLALDEPYRSTLLLRYFDDASPRELAARLGVPLPTITSRLTRAHALLRERLERRRGAWIAALAPLLPRRELAPLLGPGVLLMSATTKLLFALALVAATVVAFEVTRRDAPPPRAVDVPAQAQDARPAATASARELAAAPSERAALVGAADAAASAAAPTPALAGVVRLPDGAPAAGAFVLLGAWGDLDFLARGEVPGDERRWTRADEAGAFALFDVPPGATYVTAVAPEHAPSDTAAFGFEPAAPRLDLELRLRVGGRLWGEVLRKDGSLARDRKLRLLQEPSAGEASGGARLLLNVVTDAQGRFDERHLRPGRWGLLSLPTEEEAAALGGSATEQMVQVTVDLTDGGEAYVRLGAAAATPVRVHGALTLGDAPLTPGMMQWIAECDDPMGSQVLAEADDAGRYDVELPWPGAWYVRVMALGVGVDEEFQLDVPAVAAHELDLRLPVGEVRGRVLDEAGRPVQGAVVGHLVLAGPAYGGDLSLGVDRVTTDADGAFRLRGMAAGTYQFGASRAGVGVATPRALELGTDEVRDGLELVLRGGTPLRGRVVDAEGLPAARAPIWIEDTAGNVLEPLTPTRTNGEGRFTTPPLPAGEYTLIARVGLLVARSDWLRAQVDAGEVELRLERGGTLVVELAAGDELVRGRVCVRDEAGRLFTGLRSSDDPWAWKRYPFDSRRKRIGPLPTGNYRVEAFVPGRPSRTREVAVTAGATQELRFEP